MSSLLPEKINTEENRDILSDMQRRSNVKIIIKCLDLLEEANKELITQDNFNALIKANDNVMDVAYSLDVLLKTNKELVTQDNFNALIKTGNIAGRIAEIFELLLEKNKELVTQDNFNALVQAGSNAEAEPKDIITPFFRPEKPENTRNSQGLIEAAGNVSGISSIPSFY